MRYLLLFLLLLLSCRLYAGSITLEPVSAGYIQSDKIKLEFISMDTNNTKKLYSWLIFNSSSGISRKLLTRRIKVILDFKTIDGIKIVDVNVGKKGCKKHAQSWKKKVLLLILFENVSIPHVIFSTTIPCVLTNSAYQRYIKLRVLVKKNEETYYNTFTLHN